MKNNLILFTFMFVAISAFAQKKVTWENLSKVKFEEKYFPAYDEYFLYPKFDKSIQDINGKTITIEGYFLDVASGSNTFILSLNPMASCFFCGAVGPETAMELHFKDKPKLRTDDYVRVTGIFKLNADDVDHLNYILENCIAEKIN
ncbi:hypothetical protein PK35_00830 [Tamlana nanhaiensis]|uniref:DUF3299 domain-containing protein n=1 Tax=Neotamlana nanhaiensis TaxID=1382798 RepID=A0A0D7W6Q9_9FLAO|nr:hypothetical protein [Tamlana nanhaiensis]KJD34383.1 hypothetical protein PK35_00830 [Tamlana nanhaiensis]